MDMVNSSAQMLMCMMEEIQKEFVNAKTFGWDNG
jgi:hypothetical protein